MFPHLPHWRETGRLVSYSETGTRPVTFCLLLNGRQRTVKASNEEYDAMTGGVGHVTLWYVRGEDLLPSKTVTTYDLRGLNADLSGIAWMTRERPPSSSSSSSSSGTKEQKEGKKRGRRVRMQEDELEDHAHAPAAAGPRVAPGPAAQSQGCARVLSRLQTLLRALALWHRWRLPTRSC